ncbi:hypothetical protein OAD49_00475 [Flavobacteriaceae bacterium]|nr:hypothetical protein [Flavobacteriaceae bacterium]
MGILKLILLSAFVSVVYQDLKDRSVYWFLFPAIGICAGTLFFKETSVGFFLEAILLNLLFIGLLLGVIFLYTTYKLKMKLSDAFGLGDGLLFVALVFSFAQLTFMIVFVFGLVGSLLLHLVLKKYKSEFVPLAGYMSVFFALAYGAHWMGFLTTVYTL